MARAEALKARTFYQPVGPGELEIPAIHGVGGSLLYFLEQAGKNWDTDFEPLRSDAGADALLAVDHISQSMPYDEMLSWLLFYTGILDLQAPAADGDRRSRRPGAEPGPHQRRPEPALRAQRLLRQPDAVGALHLGVFWLGRAARRVLVRRYLCDRRRRCARAARTSWTFPTITTTTSKPNTISTPRLWRQLRDNHILYDREGDGEFFQVYTHIFDERFFFEIVERRNYQGFGAANAGIRLAAQAREVRPASMPRV